MYHTTELRFQRYIIIAVTAFVLGGYIFATSNTYLVPFALALAGGMFYLLAHYRLLTSSNKIRSADYYAVIFVCAVNIWILLAIASYVCEKIGTMGKKRILLCVIVGVLLLALIVLELWKVIAFKNKRECLRNKTTTVSERAAALIFALILIALNLDIFNTWPRWDNYAYITELERLCFSSLRDLSNLRVADHATYAYSVVFIFINMVVSNANTTAYLLNYIYLLGGTFCFWILLKKLFPNRSYFERLLAVCLFSFSPYFLGQMACVNLEFYAVFAFLLFLAGEATGVYVIQFAGAALMCFGKESSTVALACMMLGKIIVNVIRVHPKNGKEWISALDIKFSGPVLCMGLLWLWDVLNNNWMASNQTEFLTVDGKEFNAFGISGFYIKDKLITLLCANFDWVFFSILTIAFVIYVIRWCFGRRRKYEGNDIGEHESGETFTIWAELTGVLIGGMAMQLLFITYNNIRYFSILIPIVYIISFAALGLITRRRWLRNTICAVAAVCLLAQSFYTVDPVMLFTMPRMSTGSGYIVSSENSAINVGAAFIDTAQYNRQIKDFDSTFDKLLGQIEYDTTNTCIVISSEYETPTVGGVCSAIHLILGFGYPYYESAPRNVIWDSEKQCRKLSQDDEDLLNVFFVSSADQISELSNQYSRVFYFRMPWQDNLYEEQLSELNCFSDPFSVEANGWKLCAYQYQN